MVIQDIFLIYKFILFLLEIWTPPAEWIGPDPALYFSFDTLEVVTPMAGTEEGNFNALVPGKVGVCRSSSGDGPDDPGLRI